MIRSCETEPECTHEPARADARSGIVELRVGECYARVWRPGGPSSTLIVLGRAQQELERDPAARMHEEGIFG